MAVTGFVEYAGANRVSGWVYDSGSPSARLEVTVRIGDEFYASGFADIARHDLLLAGIGDGKHGFAIDVSEATLSAEEVAALEVHAISGVEVIKIARVHVVPELILDLKSDPLMPTSDARQFPVFILGPARSGTSAVTLALLESGSYIGTGEGHLMPLAHELLSLIDRHYQRAGAEGGTTLARVSSDAFQKLTRRAFVKLAADLFPTPRWLDKTPTVEMVRASVLMRELWPNARFIFMKRRVIENVLSRRRKFPEGTTESHYSDWAAVMTAWLAVRGKLGTAALEIDHRQLFLDPRDVATSIAVFLELPEPAAARFSRYICQSRPEQTDENFGATYSLDELRLDEQQARRMMAVCDPVMTAFGYGYGEAYYSGEA
jgi:sulfotransferase family protein